MALIECLPPGANATTGERYIGQFFIKNATDEEVALLSAVHRAMDRVYHAPKNKEEDLILPIQLHSVLALQATGFEWTNEAAVQALGVLSDAVRGFMIIQPVYEHGAPRFR